MMVSGRASSAIHPSCKQGHSEKEHRTSTARARFTDVCDESFEAAAQEQPLSLSPCKLHHPRILLARPGP
eukprot:3553774-Rhodomonas_salina.2